MVVAIPCGGVVWGVVAPDVPAAALELPAGAPVPDPADVPDELGVWAADGEIGDA